MKNKKAELTAKQALCTVSIPLFLYGMCEISWIMGLALIGISGALVMFVIEYDDHYAN